MACINSSQYAKQHHKHLKTGIIDSTPELNMCSHGSLLNAHAQLEINKFLIVIIISLRGAKKDAGG